MWKICLLLVLTPITDGYKWFTETFPNRPALETFTILPRDNSTGCKVIYFPDCYYFYGDPCVGVPASYPVHGRQITIRTSKIRSIEANDFQQWTHIEKLSLEMNTLLETIEPGAFRNLTNLRNLSISNNFKLKALHRNVFKGLINLKELSFINNNMKKLEGFVFTIRPSILPALRILDISENPISSIKKTDFLSMEGSEVEIFCLTFCNIVSIEPESFAPFKSLISLNIASNYLNGFNFNEIMLSVNETAENLTQLNLGSSLLNKDAFTLLKTIATMGITSLDLKENHFEALTPGFFPRMPNVVTLDLTGIKATSLENGTLSQDIMPNLKNLILAKNRMAGLMEGFILPNIEKLDISENTCESCFTSSLFKIGEYELETMKSLKILILSKNNLYHIRRYYFYGLDNLEALFLSNCSLYKIDLYSFGNLTNLVHLDLSHNNFIMSYALKTKTFAGLDNLISLKLDFCSITAFSEENIFSFMSNLQYLNIKNNAIIEFHSSTFHSLTNLVIADISYNELLEWNERLFDNNVNLQSLSLISNQISEITLTMFSDFKNLKFVDLSENPFFCTCSAVNTVLDYIKALDYETNYNLNAFHLNDTKNVCFAPRRKEQTELIDYLNYNIRTGYCSRYLIVIGLTVVGIVVSLISISCLIYYMRWYIRYWLFMLRQKLGFNYFPKKQKTPSDGKYKYDAFVSYSHEDRSFVVRLVAMLESQEPHYSLCVFERDFNVGGAITENVVESLAASRRTILILSDSFARSTWCLWEMQMVHHKWLFFKDKENEPMIIIKIGEIMDRHMTPTLRYLMKTRVYLQWNSDPIKQKVFWQKLKEALSPSRV